jgi:hypothetical protein
MYNITKNERLAMTPESGFNLVGIDPFAGEGSRLYLIYHFDQYKDALDAKKQRKNQDEYMILYYGME